MCVYGYCRISTKQQSGKAGYRVKYPDGYESWSPKDVFEQAYRKLDCTDFINFEE